jgi:Ser/Thr protein kinase RdoA (MazF antagonist)
MDVNDPTVFTREFMRNFLFGYQKVYTLDPTWLKEIPYFLKLREIELYAVIHRDFDVDNIDDAWCARFMQDRKQKIETEAPFINLTSRSLSIYLS